MRSTRSSHLVLAGVVAALILVPTQAHAATQALPDGAQPLGQSMAQWQQTFVRWALGSSDNPIFTDACGTHEAKAFLVAPPTNPSGERHCDVPVGKALVISPAATFSEIPTYGDTDAEVIADAEAAFGFLEYSHAILDGRELNLGDGRSAGAYDLIVEEGSFYDLIAEGTPDDWAPGDVVRLASVSQVLVLPPLRPGMHTIELEASFSNGLGYYHETMVLHVG
jgi:hypothetical protein